jgi:hypothetical protein
MTDFLTMKNRIEGEIARTNLTSQVGDAINTAIAKYARRPWFFNQATATFNTVANQEYYGAADLSDIPNIVKIYAMRVLISDVTRKVDERPFALLDLRNSTSDYTGPPIIYSYFAQQIRFSPIPDDTRRIDLAYQTRLTPTPLSNDTDTNAWMTEGEELIRNAAKRDLWANVIRNYDAAQVAKAEEAEALSDLLRESTRRITTGTLYTDVPSQGWFNIREGVEQ